jgi:hypothetical protein
MLGKLAWRVPSRGAVHELETRMRKLIVASMLALAGSAWGQTSWSNGQFTASTDNMTFASIVGGSVVVMGLPQLLTLSNAGFDANLPPTFFDLAFVPAAGYALHGETVSFSVAMDVGEYAKPSNLMFNAFASVSVGANGASFLDKSSAGGKTAYSGTFFVADPDLAVEAGAVTHEGTACPLGEEADGCDFGISLVFLDSAVRLTSLSVTPLLSAVPEPGMAALWTPVLGVLAAGALARRRRGARAS